MALDSLKFEISDGIKLIKLKIMIRKIITLFTIRQIE